SSDRAGQPQVYIMSAEGGDVRRLTYEDNYNDSPAWSPRGDKIAYVTRLEGEFQICTIDITGENLIRLTSQGSSENPHWSPDGLHIVFSSNRSGKHQIYTMNWDGSEQKPITGQGNNYNPDWSTGF
ncbi:MAG TPA: Tol-Pal system beta propeller repeat protein TolB, partial [candidate division Zixibacteria bacterium]